MEKKFYVDTSVWRDYFEDRKDNLRPLGEFAFQFLKKCKTEKSRVIVSNLIFDELKPYYSKEEIAQVFEHFKDIIIFIEIKSEQFNEAMQKRTKYPEIPMHDILHAIIARDNNTILVSRDKHFEELDFIDVFTPEDLL